MFSEINIELTSKCDKHCWMCNRWQDNKSEKGDMPKYLVDVISRQIPANTIIHLHNNGEPLCYPDIGYAISVFKKKGCIVQFDTNGNKLMARCEEVKEADIISVSIIENDYFFDAIEQIKIMKEYLYDKKPKDQVLIARCVGNIDEFRMGILRTWNIPIVKRIIHDRSGRFDYTKEVIIPEDGICRDFMNHPAIDFMGNFYICVKYDPEKKGILGNVNNMSIASIWNSEKRMEWMKHHICNRRSLVEPCAECQYYGYPNG